MKCFFCDKHMPTYAKLAEHLLDEHNGQPAQGGGVLELRHNNPDSCWCWCNALLCVKSPGVEESLAQHLKNRGGLEAHLLEIALGNQ